MSERSEAVSLKEHLESRIHALEKATQVAKDEMDRRLEGMNRFRDQLDKQTRTFVDKDYFEHHCETNNDRIAKLESFKDQMTGKADQKSVTNAIIIAVISIAISIVSIIINRGG
jgi:hypothetical protein